MVQVRGSPATPVATHNVGTGSMSGGSSTSSAAWTTAIAANPDRKWGCLLQVVSEIGTPEFLRIRSIGDTGGGFKVSEAYSNNLTLNNPGLIELRGTGGWEVKNQAGSFTIDYVIHEF